MVAPVDIPVTVHIGVWINRFYGQIRGSTLTITQTNGALLTAFIAIFVGYSSTLLWRIACLLVQQAFATPRPRDALYHHQEVILRNSPSAFAGFWSLAKVLWAWKRQGLKSRSATRLSPFLVLAALFWIFFATVSVFSSRISSIMDDEVLISSPNCGRAEFLDAVTTLPTVERKYVLWDGYSSVRNVRSREYAASCYASLQQRNTTACSFFARPLIASNAIRNASCPFDESICKVPDRNIQLTAKVNTHDDLGLNTLPSERLDLIWSTHCAPLKSEGFKQSWNYSDSVSYMKYFYGTSFSTTKDTPKNWTVMSEVRDVGRWASLKPVGGGRYLFSKWAVPMNGSSAPFSRFAPVEELRNASHDAEIYLMFLQANYAKFDAPVDDPWYSSHRLIDNQTFPGTTVPVYLSDEEVSTLACKEQFQVCSVEGSCSRAGSVIDVYNEQIQHLGSRARVLKRVFEALSSISPAQFPVFRSVYSLARNLDAISGGRSEYWHDDVMFWQSQFLASMQGSMVDAALGTPDVANEDGDSIWKVAETEDERHFCQSQKFRSTAFMNFSILWMSVIFALGILVIILEWSLESVLTWLAKWRGQPHYALAEWKAYETHQLLRHAHEELGYGGSWEEGAGSIPLPGINEELAMIDMTNTAHPLQSKSAAKGGHVFHTNEEIALVIRPVTTSDSETSVHGHE